MNALELFENTARLMGLQYIESIKERYEISFPIQHIGRALCCEITRKDGTVLISSTNFSKNEEGDEEARKNCLIILFQTIFIDAIKNISKSNPSI